MALVKRVNNENGTPYGWRHDCPGCGGPHVINVEGNQLNGHKWHFNGDENRPTFTPSINARWGHYAENKSEVDCPACRRAKEEGRKSSCGVCHYFITDGRIVFCPDSTHKLSGQTVDLGPV